LRCDRAWQPGWQRKNRIGSAQVILHASHIGADPVSEGCRPVLDAARLLARVQPPGAG
jgi:hypothetical protein